MESQHSMYRPRCRVARIGSICQGNEFKAKWAEHDHCDNTTYHCISLTLSEALPTAATTPRAKESNDTNWFNLLMSLFQWSTRPLHCQLYIYKGKYPIFRTLVLAAKPTAINLTDNIASSVAYLVRTLAIIRSASADPIPARLRSISGEAFHNFFKQNPVICTATTWGWFHREFTHLHRTE